jgi:hypothetical protein
MRRVIPWLIVLAACGCQGVVGPREHRADPVRVDAPYLTIEEQQRLGRDRLALPEQSQNIAPRAYPDFLGPHGR